MKRRIRWDLTMLWTCGLALLAALPVSVCSAQLSVTGDTLRDGAGPGKTRASAAAGVFLPYTSNASLNSYRAVVYADTGYDAVRAGTVETLRGEIVLIGPEQRRANVGLSVFAGGGYAAPDVAAAAKGSAYGGLKLQALRQDRHQLDLAFAGRYTSQGYNLLPEVVLDVLLSRRIGMTTLLLNGSYGHSTRDNDRFLSLRAAVLVRVLEALSIGVDGKASTDLERDTNEPDFEPQFEVQSSGLLTYAFQNVSFTARTGYRAIRYRLQPGLHSGAEAGFAVATAF